MVTLADGSQLSLADEPVLGTGIATESPLQSEAALNQNLAIDKNPEEEAEILRLSTETGLAPNVVRFDRPAAKVQAEKVPVQELSPALLDFVARKQENAALIKDDTRAVDNVVSTWETVNTYFEGLKRDTAAAYTTGRAGRDVSFLYYDKFINDVSGLDEQIGIFESEIKRPERTDLFGQIVTATAEQLPIQFDLIPAGISGALTGATAAAAAGIVGGVPGVVLLGLTGAKLGFQLGIAQRAFFLGAGSAAKEYSDFVDEDGSKLEPIVLKNAAVLAGVLNAGLEVIGETFLLKLIPGLKGLVSSRPKELIKNALKTKTFRTALRKIILDYGSLVGIEATTEAIQELTTIGIGEAIKEIEFEAPKHLTKEQIFSRVGEAGQQALLASLGFGFVGASTQITIEGVKAQRANTFYEEQLRVKDAVEATKLQERLPEKMKEVLETAGMDQEVSVSGEALQDFKQVEGAEGIFDKLGITEEVITDTQTTGQDVNLKLSDLQTLLTADESDAFFTVIRETPESKSQNEADTFDPLAESQVILEADTALRREFTEFNKEKKRLETEILEVSTLRKLPEPEQQAKNVSELWSAFAERISGVSDQTPAETLKRLRVEPSNLVDVERAKLFIEDKDLQNTIPLGVTKISAEGSIIKLFENADTSTLLHETGHVFFNEILTLENLGKASDGLVTDIGVLKEWLKVDVKVGITRDQQDVFARGFERYLREGKAPSAKLKSAFERFKTWLMAVYRTIKSSPLDVKLTDDVREVFDRLLSSEQESFQFIQENEFHITDSEISSLNLPAEEVKLWQKTINKGFSSAKEKLQNSQAKVIAANRKTWTQEAREQVAQEQVYLTVDRLSDKEQVGLNKAGFTETFGQETVDRFKEKKYRFFRKGETVIADVVAADQGYANASDMVNSLTEAPLKQDRIDEVIAAKEAAALEDATIEDAYLNFDDSLDRYFETLSRFLRDKAGIEEKTPRRIFKKFVDDKFQDFLIKDATRTDRFLWAMKRALKAKDKAVKAGDFQTAFEHAQQARLSFEYARKTRKIKENTTKLKKLSQKAFKAKGRIDFEYWKNIVNLANRFKLIRTKVPKDLQPIRGLLETGKSLMDNGPDFSSWLMDGATETSFQELKVSNFTEVDNLIRHLDFIGRAKSADRTALSEGGSALLAQDLIAKTAELKKLEYPTQGSPLRKLSDVKRKFIAHLDTFHNITLQLDGFQNVGVKGTPGLWERQIYQPLAKADSEQLRISADLRTRLTGAFDQLNKSFQKNSKISADIKTPVPQKIQDVGNGWTFETVVSLALNMGNSSNIKAVQEGYGLTQADINEVLKPLTNEDWDAVQTIWDTMDFYRDPLFQTRERMIGFQPEKVEADAFVTPTGKTMRGGYYPLKEDRQLAGGKTPTWDAQEDLILTMNGAFSAGVPAVALKERKGFGGKPVRLSLSVLAQHLDFVAKYISHAEVLRDVDRMLKNPEVAGEMLRKLGPEANDNMRGTLQNIARNNNEQLDIIDRFFLGARRLSTVFILGAKVSVSLKQVYSLGGFIEKQGFGTLVDGIKELTKNSIQGDFVSTVKTVKDLSPFMAARFNNLDVNINRAVNNQILKKHVVGNKSLQEIRDMMFTLIKIADFAAVMPAWLGAFNKGKRQFKGDVAKAVLFADTAIRTTQPSTRPIDLTPIQQSRKGMAQAVTMFSTFTLLFGNIQRTQFRAFNAGKMSKAEFTRSVMWNFIIPPIAMNLMFAALRGEAPEPKEVALDFLSYQTIGIPVIKDLAFAAANVVKGKRVFAPGFDSPIFTPLDLAESTSRAMIGWLQDMGSDKKRDNAIWALAEISSFMAGIPATSIYKQLKAGIEKAEKFTE